MVDKFSQDKINQIKDAFDLFDKNGDGQICTQELGQVLSSLGQNPSKQQLQEMINQVDKDGNGTIQFSQFLYLISNGEFQQQLREAFNVFDLDGDGAISKSQLMQLMTKLGEMLTEFQIEQMIKEADCNCNGQIDFQQFKKMMMK